MSEPERPPQGQGQWWVRTPAGQFGPIDLETIQLWVQQGRIGPQDFITSAATGTWLAAGNVPQLAGLFPAGMGMSPYATPLPQRRGLGAGWIIGAVSGGVVVVISIMAALLVPALNMARQRAQQCVCMNNLNQLGRAAAAYSTTGNDILPWQVGASEPRLAWRDLGILYSADYVVSVDDFICPASKDKAFTPVFHPGVGGERAFAAFEQSETISYAYSYDNRPRRAQSWHLAEVGDPVSLRLLADKKAGIDETGMSATVVSHRARGRVVSYVDGRVEWGLGLEALDPDEGDSRIGAPGPRDYTDWWSDPPYHNE